MMPRRRWASSPVGLVNVVTHISIQRDDRLTACTEECKQGHRFDEGRGRAGRNPRNPHPRLPRRDTLGTTYVEDETRLVRPTPIRCRERTTNHRCHAADLAT